MLISGARKDLEWQLANKIQALLPFVEHGTTVPSLYRLARRHLESSHSSVITLSHIYHRPHFIRTPVARPHHFISFLAPPLYLTQEIPRNRQLPFNH